LDTRTAYREHLAEMARFASALALLGWDQHAHMPKKGGVFRAQVTAMLAQMHFERGVSDDLGRYLDELKSDTSLSEAEAGSVRRIGKEYKREKAIPPALIAEVAAARSEAQQAWAQARQASDFSMFKPHLEKMVDYGRRFADYYTYDEHPYDGLLEGFEPGMTVNQLHEIIEPLRAQTVPFLKKLLDEGEAPDPSLLTGTFDVDVQRKLAHRALEAVGYDFDAGALDDVPHPFTTSIGPDDVRVTNRYAPDYLGSGLFAALHEGGHAIYNQGMPTDLFLLGIPGGSSNGIHESQSRMIENQIGRSLPFWRFFQPILAEYFPQFSDASPDDLYRASNHVSPSLIRVEADEVTYNFHIMLRFELEAGLIDGSIRVADLPRLWNEAMERYVGVVPENDAVGVLQDVHWSMGAFGYFPSYMLGNLYAAQLFDTLRQGRPNLDEEIASGDFTGLLGWLREHVHQYGAIYEPTELMTRVTGKPLDSSHFVNYIQDKFSAVYKVK